MPFLGVITLETGDVACAFRGNPSGPRSRFASRERWSVAASASRVWPWRRAADDRAIEIARSVDGVETVDDMLSVVDPQTVRPRRALRTEDCTAVYITRPGDTLPKIAERVLGERRRWRELRDANRKVVTTGVLAPGLRLKIPS